MDSHPSRPSLDLSQWNSVFRCGIKKPPSIPLERRSHCPTAKKKPTPKSSTSTYRQAYDDLLAVPVIPGVKSEKEKFDGGLYM
ncbi:putative prolyl-tRNA synthetase, partial [Coprinopsis sp. MPI-PUGE-AT-0042]